MERVFGHSRILATGAPAPSCTVTVVNAGTATPSTLYADDLAVPTPKANPFTADSAGFWFFYAGAGRYDITFSGGGIVTPYTLADVPAGLGDGTIVPFAFASLPATSAPHAGRLARVTDTQRGLWIDDGTGWAPVLDYALRSFTFAGLPAAGVAGRLRRVTDQSQGLYLDDGAAWTPVLAYALLDSSQGGLPAAALTGRLRHLNNDALGVWMDSGAGGAWFGINGEVANAVEFGAKRDNSTDDRAAIQAAIDSRGAGGVVVLPPGAYKIAGPLTLALGVTLYGPGSTIAAHASFSGDCMIRATNRDDNTPGTEDKFVISDLIISSPAAPSSGFSCIDLTGATGSVVRNVRLIGPGSGATNGSALRIADRNPSGSSNKRCQDNLLHQVFAQNWPRFLTLAQATSGEAAGNIVSAFKGDSIRIGLHLSGITAGVPRLVLVSGKLVGDNNAASKLVELGATTLPGTLTILQMTFSSFTDTTGIPGETFFTTAPGIGPSGTSSVSALAASGTLGQNFFGSAYLKLASGTALAAGSNTFVYTLPAAPVGPTFFVAPVSGMPGTVLAFQASLSGTTLTVTVVAASAVTLSSDLVFRVLQLTP